MNSSPDRNPEAIRSEIDRTRERMDGTMDALGERLQPQHLVDEVLGFFRGSDSDGKPRLQGIQQKFTEGADRAMHTVVDTVKRNPIPALLIGGGIAWLIYESRRARTDGPDAGGGERRYDPENFQCAAAAFVGSPNSLWVDAITVTSLTVPSS